MLDVLSSFSFCIENFKKINEAGKDFLVWH